MKITAVVMAGGKGERFWPKSRTNLPKQFLSLTEDGKTMLQLTVERLSPLVCAEDIFLVTNRDYFDLAREQLPELPAENILAEPAARNTAPCVGFAAAAIRRKYGDAVMLVLPSDHLIKNADIYMDTLRQAVTVAEDGKNLVTIGIMPTYPETGYGYIDFRRNDAGSKYQGVYLVNGFVEKPDINTAKEYLASGQYLWNSGMFVWKASTILGEFERLIPQMYAGLQEIEKAMGTPDFARVLSECYKAFPSESIDYGIMERAENIYTIPGNFDWDDVGSWLALERVNRTNEYGNLVRGDVITIGTKNTTILGDRKLIAAVGLEGMVVVDTEDALLICAKDCTQDIKKVIENLKICNRINLT